MVLQDLSVLIIVYRRYDNLESIIETCLINSVFNIYIAADIPKEGDFEAIEDSFKVAVVIEKYEKILGSRIKVWRRSENLGCAVSVLTACDWFFKQVTYGIILEDDCLPTKHFFNYANEVRTVLSTNENVWLACGTQYAPLEIFEDSWILARYPLNWGWITNKDKWLEISSAIRNRKMKLNLINESQINLQEAVYWNAGARRAYQSQVDVWDTILVQKMIKNAKLAVLPNVPLVTNNGNDLIATNVNLESSWTNLQTFEFNKSIKQPIFSMIVTSWLRDNFFQILIRHLLTTQITFFLDFTIRRVKKQKNLLSRWVAIEIPGI